MNSYLRQYAREQTSEPDDVLQDVQIYISSKQINPTLEYLKLAIKHRAMDLAKARRRREFYEKFGFWREHEVNDPAILYERKEEYELALSCLLNIREPYRTTMYLFYIKDLSVKEIMQQLNRPEGTILKRLHTGRRLAVEQYAKLLQ